jgi:hypothetical protein
MIKIQYLTVDSNKQAERRNAAAAGKNPVCRQSQREVFLGRFPGVDIVGDGGVDVPSRLDLPEPGDLAAFLMIGVLAVASRISNQRSVRE